MKMPVVCDFTGGICTSPNTSCCDGQGTFCELHVHKVPENLTKDPFTEKKTCYDNSLCKRCVWKYNGGCSEWPG